MDGGGQVADRNETYKSIEEWRRRAPIDDFGWAVEEEPQEGMSPEPLHELSGAQDG